jgi:hypothetical protein
MGNLSAVLELPLVDIKTQAVTYYVQSHLRTPEELPDVLKGVSSDFTPRWQFRSEFPMLEHAVSCMALGVFSRNKQHPPAAIEASLTYQRLIHMIRDTIISLEKQNIDACLLSIFFMSRYEHVVYCPKYPLEKVELLHIFSHHDGALAILKIWKERLSHVQPATDVIRHTRRSMVRSALIRKRPLPEWIIDGAPFGEHGLEAMFDRILVQIVSLRWRLVKFLENRSEIRQNLHECISESEELNNEARNIDQALIDWPGYFPTTWCYKVHELPNTKSTRVFCSPVVYSYSSLAYATVWNMFFSTRMIINTTRLRILETLDLSESISEQRAECLSNIKSMAHHIASTTPFALQKVKITSQNEIMLSADKEVKPSVALMGIWALSVASSIKEVEPKLQLWFGSELKHLGEMTGDSIVQSFSLHGWFQI